MLNTYISKKSNLLELEHILIDLQNNMRQATNDFQQYSYLSISCFNFLQQQLYFSRASFALQTWQYNLNLYTISYSEYVKITSEICVDMLTASLIIQDIQKELNEKKQIYISENSQSFSSMMNSRENIIITQPTIQARFFYQPKQSSITEIYFLIFRLGCFNNQLHTLQNLLLHQNNSLNTPK